MTQSEDLDPFEELRERVAAAWNPELFREAGHRAIDVLSDHLARVQDRSGRVLNWRPPEENIALAAETLAETPDAAPERLRRLFELILARGQNLNHPRYIGHQVPPPSPIAGLFDAVGAVTNQVMGIYEMGPFTTGVEQAVANKLGEKIGWDVGTFSGVMTHGGSLANLTALLVARNKALVDSWTRGTDPSAGPCLVAHADAHYCVHRSAGILGIGTDNIHSVPLDADRCIDCAALDCVLTDLRDSGRTVIAVAAAACTTATGAFDDLNAVAEVCEKHRVWLHVDAAHGGGALLSTTHARKLDGISRADSVVWDAHKMLYVPALCAFLFFRNREDGLRAFRQDAPYLFDDGRAAELEYDSATRTLECTKRAAALSLWGLWTTFGEQFFGDAVDLTFALTREFFSLARDAAAFEVPYEPQANILLFRYVPASGGLTETQIDRLQSAIRQRVIRSGGFYFVQTVVDGRTWLRVTVMNPLVTVRDFVSLLSAIRDAATQADVS